MEEWRKCRHTFTAECLEFLPVVISVIFCCGLNFITFVENVKKEIVSLPGGGLFSNCNSKI
jgi:hypothetical protein